VRRGVTLVELIVALAILGLLSGLAAAALGGLRQAQPDARAQALARARVHAIRTGTRVRVDDPSGESVVFLPDGRTVGGAMDPFTGGPADANH
jgi:prepilin-type N-terminal cleavage/methylation domain-containing protein